MRISKRERQIFCPLILSLLIFVGCQRQGAKEKQRSSPVPELVKKQAELIGEPRVERISDHVWAAMSYDLCNTVLIHTNDGNVIVDPSMSPKRARLVKQALSATAPQGRVKAIIYTHSHIDHIGGTSVWMEDGTEIWATDAFPEHLLKQYEKFQAIETIRARRQFGEHISKQDLPIQGIGPRMDIKAAKQSGVRLPTHTFSGVKALKIGGLSIELNEAPGETHDQLFVWIPKDKTIIAGDNFYYTFPNLYTIRGTSPRPVDEWIKSIDAMRRKDPLHLIPNHTRAVHGASEIREALTNYRDAIQWIRDQVVRGANRGEDVDTLAQTIKLPAHLKDLYYNLEFYGQVDWSVRAIYCNNLGWFDGRPEKLYPVPKEEAAAREIKLIGGADKVMALADRALEQGDVRWSIHLLSKLSDSGLARGGMQESLSEKLAQSYERLAAGLYNLNGRAYLLESAYELRHGIEKPEPARLDEDMVATIPLDMIFNVMVTRLIPERAMDVHETVHFVFPDEDVRFVMTVRRGVAEMVKGEPLSGTPKPVAVLTMKADVYRKIATNLVSPAYAFAKGEVEVEGSWLKFLAFMRRFDMEG